VREDTSSHRPSSRSQRDNSRPVPDLNATGYFERPFRLDEFMKLGPSVRDLLTRQAQPESGRCEPSRALTPLAFCAPFLVLATQPMIERPLFHIAWLELARPLLEMLAVKALEDGLKMPDPIK